MLRSLERFTGRELVGATHYEGPIFNFSARARRLPDPHGRVRDDRGRHRHRAPRAGVRRGRLPRRGGARAVPFDPTRPETLLNPVHPDGTFDQRVRSHEGARIRGPLRQGPELDERADRRPARARAAVARARTTSTPTRTAGAAALPCSTTPSHPGTSPLRGCETAAGGQRDSRLAPAARQARPLWGLAVEQRRLGALARALLGHAAAGVALRRGHIHVIGSFAELEKLLGTSLADHHRPYVDDIEFPCPRSRVRAADAARAGGDRRVVRLRRDAVRPVPRPVRESGALRESAFPPTSSARRSTRPAAGSTRCSPSPRSSSTRAPYRNVVCLGLILDAEGQKMSKSQRQHGRAVAGARHLRRGRLPLVLLHLQAAVGRLPLLDGDDRRGCAAVPQAAVVHLLLLRPLRPGSAPSARASAPARHRAIVRRIRRDLDRWALSRTAAHGRVGEPSAWTPTMRRARAARSPNSWTSSPTGTCAARARRFWDGDPRRVPRRCARACSRSRSC